jgi:hypothetical protein
MRIFIDLVSIIALVTEGGNSKSNDYISRTLHLTLFVQAEELGLTDVLLE